PLCRPRRAPPPFPYTTLFRSDLVQRGRAAAAARAVLDVVDDQRAGVQRLDQQRQLGAQPAGLASGEAVQQLDQPRADLLAGPARSEEHTSELQSLTNLVCRPL